MKNKKILDTLEKLRRLAKDQKGTPEGDLAEDIIQKILTRYPDIHIEDIKTTQWQNKFKHEFELQLWMMAAKGHSIKLVKYNADDPLEFISEGNELDMIVTKNEWEFACRLFTEMSTQVMRGIVNKLWPQVCKDPGDIAGYKESEYKEFADAARDKTVVPRTAITDRSSTRR